MPRNLTFKLCKYFGQNAENPKFIEVTIVHGDHVEKCPTIVEYTKEDFCNHGRSPAFTKVKLGDPP